MVAAYHINVTPSGVVQHAYLIADESSSFWYSLHLVYRVICNGAGAVVYFFVLSGFVLTISLSEQKSSIIKSFIEFAARRAIRLYSVNIAATMMFFAVSFLVADYVNVFHVPSITKLVGNLLLLRTDILGLTWTLQVEVIAIPLVFGIAMLGYRYGIGLPAVVTILLIALSFGPRMGGLLSDGTIVRHLFCFAIGCLVALAREPITKWIAGQRAAPILVLCTIGFFAARPLLGYASQWSFVFEALFGAAIIGILAYGPALSARRALETPLPRFVGRVSFSFYLLHPLPLFAIYSLPPMIETGLPGLVVAFGLFVGSTVVTLPLAWLTWRLVEVPSTRLGRRFSGSEHPATKAAPHR